ncbi:hypothetical protein [Paracraurococcus ruber]|uniref:Class I SAM-dependent methyltransferase n=1 Tax=Paracraurococcus ruber TaxID=77675 RepID=A0ABS1D8Q2_9PROT|nr:hypothetical protein [Paracraurococcus ruber]MBK1662826.1 hypothetical protein [Paracraurococcus ruber]TDG27496.1 hypothetical protein E2C05_22640 [Paracraurococcus ruber]
MDLAMSLPERLLLEGVFQCAGRYVEFGAGGSTCLAAGLVRQGIISVDSAPAWLDQVREACAARALPVQPVLVHADIGETGPWGYPADASRREAWPGYHAAPWALPGAADADLCLVDGRFRVACCMQALLHCRPDTLVAIHDFAPRRRYHVVREVAREVAAVQTLSLFVRRPDFDPRLAQAILAAHAFEPS